MVPPVAVRTWQSRYYKDCTCTYVWDLQFRGNEFLYDIPRLSVEYPKERLVGKAWDFLPDAVDVVDGVTFR